ncbi:MAG: hypothetical protein H6Q69_2728 [Firmicutes bacterium]|nr:hypothetical protein [Bacillota bacterium]
MTTSILSLVTKALELNQDCLALEEVSSEYFYAQQNAQLLKEEIQNLLPPDKQKRLVLLDEKYTAMFSAGTSAYYRQGFVDAIRLLTESLTWGPTRS